MGTDSTSIPRHFNRTIYPMRMASLFALWRVIGANLMQFAKTVADGKGRARVIRYAHLAVVGTKVAMALGATQVSGAEAISNP